MRIGRLLAGASVAGALAIAAWPAQAQQARYLAANCANCHGTDGHAVGDGIPALAGMPQVRFVERMRAFREGKRSATIMHQIAKGYSDDQIARMAEHFSKQSVK